MLFSRIATPPLLKLKSALDHVLFWRDFFHLRKKAREIQKCKQKQKLRSDPEYQKVV